MLQPLFIYDNHNPALTTVAASDTLTGYTASAVLQANQDTSWRSADAVGTKTLTFDFGVPLTHGALGIDGEYLNGVTMEVRASSDNFVASDVEISAAEMIGTYTTTYRLWSNVAYRYWRVIFTTIGASTEIYHAAFCRQELLPFLADGFDPAAYQTTGEVLISPGGHHLGSIVLRTMRSLSLDFGQLTSAEVALFEAWAEVCVRNLQPFFFIPDSSATLCHFGWVDSKYKFGAAWKKGQRDVPNIPFTTRMP